MLGSGLRAVVFDLDGTLVDTLADVAFAMNEALAVRGHVTHPLASYRAWIGGGAADLARRATPDEDELEGARVLGVFRERYAERLVVESRPYPGIDDALARLASRGLALAVLSNKPDEPTRRLVDTVFPGRFAEICGQRDGVPKKPDPTALFAVAARLGVRASELAMVGDSAIDVETAKRAGAFAIGVAWGYRPERELREAGADRVLAAPADLIAALG